MRIAAGNLRFLKGEDSRIVMRVAGYLHRGQCSLCKNILCFDWGCDKL